MIVEITKDKELIIKLMDDIWPKVCNDADNVNFNPRLDDLHGWLIVKDYDNIVAIAFIEQTTLSSATMHPYLLGKKGQGRDAIKAILRWFAKENKVHKVNISIAKLYQSTYNTAKRIGFIDEGVLRENFLKNGIHYDQYLLGLTIKEIGLLL